MEISWIMDIIMEWMKISWISLHLIRGKLKEAKEI